MCAALSVWCESCHASNDSSSEKVCRMQLNFSQRHRQRRTFNFTKFPCAARSLR